MIARKPDIRTLKNLAERGDAAAQNDLGILLSTGWPGIAKNEKEAVTWILKAAEQSHPEAQCTLGWWYFRGKCGLKVDHKLAMKWFKLSAGQGFAESINNMGEMYTEGAGVKKDPAKAKELFEQAALSNNASAEHHLGIMYYHGNDCVKKDKKKGIEFLRKAREHADNRHNDILPEINSILNEKIHNRMESIALVIVLCILLLIAMELFFWLMQPSASQYHQAGMACLESDANRAFYLLKRSADAGNVKAKLQTGICCADGIGTPVDIDQARKYLYPLAESGETEARKKMVEIEEKSKNLQEKFKWLLLLAKDGDIDAQADVATCYLNGIGTPVSLKEATRWYLAIGNQDDAEFQLKSGTMHYEGKGTTQNFQQAFECFMKAAQQGNSQAQHALGDMYYAGHGVVQNYQEAVKWYQKAAEQGNADAQTKLKAISDSKINTKEDQPKTAKPNALKTFEDILKVAEQGNANAQCRLAVIYYIGQNVEQNYPEAFKWYEKAAEQGHASAQNSLGVMYYKGHGVEKNRDEAVKWFKKAAAQGHARAKENLSSCE